MSASPLYALSCTYTQSIKLKHSSPWQVLLLFHWICIDTPQFIHLQVDTCLLLCDFPFSLCGGIILACMSLALSYVCWIEANPTFPSRDSQCQSSLTCWHLPQRRRLCAALITVTAGSQITKNPCAVSICSGRSQQMHARCTHNRKQSCGVEARHTHTSGVDTEGQKVQTPY